jgi:DNA-binding CsgD family transcriptional regulator
MIGHELEVQGHVVLGRLNKQIAADLGIHERRVKLHRTAIATKLRVQSVAELTRLTDEAGIFTASKPTFPYGQPSLRLDTNLPLRAVAALPANPYRAHQFR